jgi:hypothetical protein
MLVGVSYKKEIPVVINRMPVLRAIYAILCKSIYYLVQNVVDFGTSLQKINVAKSVFSPPPPSVSNFFFVIEKYFIFPISCLIYLLSYSTGNYEKLSLLHVVASYCVNKVTFVFVLLICALLHL